MSLELLNNPLAGNFKDWEKKQPEKTFEDFSREKWAILRGKQLDNNVELTNYFDGNITNVELLLEHLSGDYFVGNKLNYSIYNKSLKEEIKDKGIPPIKIDNTAIKKQNFIFPVVHKKLTSDLANDFSKNLFYRSLQKGLHVNTSIDYISKNKKTHSILYDNKKVIYNFHIYYTQAEIKTTDRHDVPSEVDVKVEDKFEAIVLSTEICSVFLEFIRKVYDTRAYQLYQKIIFEHFEKKSAEIRDIEELKFFYDKVPDFVLNGFEYNGISYKLSDETLWNHFIHFIDYDDGIVEEDKKTIAVWTLPSADFRDESSYAIRIFSKISGEYLLKQLLPNPELVLRIYSNLDGESEYQGSAFVINGDNNSYGKTIANKTIFVSIITAHLQNNEQSSELEFTQNHETDFFQGIDLVDHKTKYQIEYSLNSHIFYKESGEKKNKIYLENHMQEFLPTGTIPTDIGIETVGNWTEKHLLAKGYYNPLEMVTFSQYIDQEDLYGKINEDCIIANVPALFVKHASDLKEWEKVHQMIRIGVDVLMILGSVSTIYSGTSGLILYAALADFGLATADIGIQNIKPDLQRTKEGREFLEQWETLYTVGTTITIGPVVIKALEKKLPQILERAVPLFHTNKLWGKAYETFSNIVLKSVYSLRIRGFTKSGLQLIKYNQCIPELGKLFNRAWRLQGVGVLFIKNIKEQVSIIYKGVVLKAGNEEEVANFIEGIIKKGSGRSKLKQELSRLAGMAENIPTGIKMTVEEFEAGLKALQETNITAKNAIEYLEKVRIYFNHHVVNGKIVQVASHNCVNVVQVVEEFLRTGKILTAKPSKAQAYYLLEKLYGKSFMTYSLSTLRAQEKIMKEGDRGILLCQRGLNEDSHVLNIVKKDGKLLFIEGQVLSQKMNLTAEFKSFKFLKTN